MVTEALPSRWRHSSDHLLARYTAPRIWPSCSTRPWDLSGVDRSQPSGLGKSRGGQEVAAAEPCCPSEVLRQVPDSWPRCTRSRLQVATKRLRLQKFARIVTPGRATGARGRLLWIAGRSAGCPRESLAGVPRDDLAGPEFGESGDCAPLRGRGVLGTGCEPLPRRRVSA